jgi:hypothetical protein
MSATTIEDLVNNSNNIFSINNFIEKDNNRKLHIINKQYLLLEKIKFFEKIQLIDNQLIFKCYLNDNKHNTELLNFVKTVNLYYNDLIELEDEYFKLNIEFKQNLNALLDDSIINLNNLHNFIISYSKNNTWLLHAIEEEIINQNEEEDTDEEDTDEEENTNEEENNEEENNEEENNEEENNEEVNNEEENNEEVNNEEVDNKEVNMEEVNENIIIEDKNNNINTLKQNNEIINNEKNNILTRLDVLKEKINTDNDKLIKLLNTIEIKCKQRNLKLEKLEKYNNILNSIENE